VLESAISAAVPETTLDPKYIASRAYTHGAALVRGSQLSDDAFAELLSDIAAHVPGSGGAVGAGPRVAATNGFRCSVPEGADPPVLMALRVAGSEAFAALTRIIDTRPLWDALAHAEKAVLAKIRVLHASPSAERFEGEAGIHPLVQRQPETGRVGFFCSLPERMPAAVTLEGKDALSTLSSYYAQCCALPSMVCEWRAGDLLVWDNRVALHKHEVPCGAEAFRVQAGAISGGAPRYVDPADFL